MSLEIESELEEKSIEDIFNEVEKDWCEKHGLSGNYGDEFLMAKRRVGSWISPLSVIAGVSDIFSATKKAEDRLSTEVIQDLGNRLGKHLYENRKLRTGPK